MALEVLYSGLRKDCGREQRRTDGVATTVYIRRLREILELSNAAVSFPMDVICPETFQHSPETV
jgi:hypothetical protein